MKVSAPDILALFPLPGFEPDRASSGSGLFSKVLAEVNDLQHRADAKIKDSLLGRADLHETMLAMERASLGLKVLVQARNKLVQAYEELSRMNM
ncbi:MAG: flagellar hook-basal body complex protein FliE [Deltaproteobacteria bacterium]|nr:flagellar hook-basal body complex protein FliE [Deltaproteobacteria bacterium]